LDSQSAQDRLHEILVIALAAIRRGELHEPVRLMGFVRTLARRQVAAHIRQAIFSRRRLVTLRETRLKAPLDESPEARTCRIEKLATLRDVLARLVARDREILQRFYLDEQCAARICDDMRLTPTQFRLYKSRALARCFDLAHQA
jgi:DNA-directed RNA polymerase specialized sigma24 family protein